MHKIQLQDAEVQLAKLIDEAAAGEEVLITRDDGYVFKIVPVFQTSPYPKFGSAKGEVEMSEDFDEPLKDFQEYMS